MSTVAQPTPHTPTPWSVDPVERADIRGADGLDVAIAICKQMGQFEITPNTCGPATRIHAGANAAFIVLACNSFDALTAERDEHNAAYASQMREINALKEQRDAITEANKQLRAALVEVRGHLKKGARNVGDPFSHCISVINAALKVTP